MSNKISDTIYFVKRKYEDKFYKNGDSSIFSSEGKEMVLKGEITNIENDVIYVKLIDKKSDEKNKVVKIFDYEIITKKSGITSNMLGKWE